MNLVRWDPFRELEEMSDRLNRVFGRPTLRHESGKETMTVTDWLPAVDISETEKEYLINIELPEVKKEDVKVTLQDNTELPAKLLGRDGAPVFLARNTWELGYIAEKSPKIKFSDIRERA